MKRKVDMLLDSGAFSAWTLQQPINVKDYIRFVKEHQDKLWGYINLDVIPGRFGQQRGALDVAKAAEASYKNLQAMKDAGLSPIPVLHRGESLKWLERLLKDGEKYIGLSPLVDTKEGERRRWLDTVFSLLTDSAGRALVKTHGFGVTSTHLMMRYPWHTVDSTAWVKSGGFGLVSIPVYENGQPNYDRLPIRLHISNQRKEKATGASYLHLGPTEQKNVVDYLTAKGFSLGEIRNSRSRRCAAMLAYFNEVEKRLPKQFKHRHVSNLRDWRLELPSKPSKHPFRLFHSTNISNDQGVLLTEFNCRSRLLSYFELREIQETVIDRYVEHGMEPDYQRRQPKRDYRSASYKSWRFLNLERRLKEYADAKDDIVGAD